MKKINLALLVLSIILIGVLPVTAQVREPDFVGEAYLLKMDSSYIQLDKEIGDFASGMSLSSNSWNAQSLEVVGGKA